MVRNTRFSLISALSCLASLTLIGPAMLSAPANAQILSDNFDDNQTNDCLWTSFTTGNGSHVSETNHRLEITHPAEANGDIFGAGYISLFQLVGDFDIQTDYRLLTWPSHSGVRVGLSLNMPYAAVERVGFGNNDFDGQPREVYLTHLDDGVNGYQATADLSGTLRMVRTGDQATGYYLDNSTNQWVLIHTGPITDAQTGVNLASWSHDLNFTDQETQIAFDNFQVNAGQVILPPCNVPEPGVFALSGTLALTLLGAARRKRKANG